MASVTTNAASSAGDERVPYAVSRLRVFDGEQYVGEATRAMRDVYQTLS